MKSKSNLFMLFFVFLITAALPKLSYTQDKETKTDKASTSEFLIKLPHTPEECLKALDDIKTSDSKLLKKINWGCMDNDHCGYLTLEAKSKEDALNQVPAAERKNASVTMVTKLSPKQIEDFHKMH